MWCSQAVVFNSADAEGAPFLSKDTPNRSAVYRSDKSNFSHLQNNSTSQEIMNVWVCLDISFQTNSTDKILKTQNMFHFCSRNSPHSISVIFVGPPGNFPATLDVDFSIRVVTSENVSEGFPEAAPRCEISEAHAQLLPPTSRIIRCKKGGWELFVETHMLLDVRCLGSSLASLWLTVVDVHFPLAEKELMAKNSVVWRETGWVLNIGHFLQDHWIILQAVTWWWLFWYQPQPITLIMNMLCCSSLLIGQCCSSEFICIPFYWVLRVLSAFFGGSLFVMLQAFGISTSILTMSWVLHR